MVSKEERERIRKITEGVYNRPIDPEFEANRKAKGDIRLAHTEDVCPVTKNPYNLTPLKKDQILVIDDGWVNDMGKNGPLSGSVHRDLYCSACGAYIERETKATA